MIDVPTVVHFFLDDFGQRFCELLFFQHLDLIFDIVSNGDSFILSISSLYDRLEFIELTLRQFYKGLSSQVLVHFVHLSVNPLKHIAHQFGITPSNLYQFSFLWASILPTITGSWQFLRSWVVQLLFLLRFIHQFALLPDICHSLSEFLVLWLAFLAASAKFPVKMQLLLPIIMKNLLGGTLSLSVQVVLCEKLA